MRMFSEEVKHTFSNSPLNILQVADFNEVFFGVYEVEINKRKYPVEEVSKYNGNPVVSIPIVVEGVEKEYPFVLLRGEEEIIFNESNTEIPESDMVIVEEAVVDNEQILIDIQNLKKEAVRQAQEELSKNTKILIEKNKREKAKKEKALKNYLESARENLVDEFTNISKRIKNELISENDVRFSEIKETIDNKIQDLADSLNESLKKDFNNSSKLIDKSIKQLVKDLYEKNINPRVDKELEEIAIEIAEKVSEIDKNLNIKIANKADVGLVEGVKREIDVIRDSNIELNNSFNKGVQKALSRVGNVDKKIVEVSEKFERKISQAEENIINYYSEKLKMLEDQTFDLTEETRKYIVELVQESKNNLIQEIRKIKDEKPIEYIIESKKKTEKIDSDFLMKNFDQKINNKINDEVARLRKYIAVYGGGGGSVAAQFADGGIMNGNLTVVGSISAIEYLGLSIPSGDYLPLSGGVMTGAEGADISNVGSIIFNNNPLTDTIQEGELRWNSEDITLDLGLNNVTLQIGQEQLVRVKVKDPLGVYDGMAVYASSTTGGSDNIEVSRFSAAADSGVDELYFIGVATEDIADNGIGFVTTFGRVREVDGRAYGTDQGVKDPADTEDWSFGKVLYVSPNVAGCLTSIKPTAPDRRMAIAMVLKAPNQENITLMVRAEHGYHLDELHDVKYDNLQDNDLLTWNNSLSVWENTSDISVNSLSATSIHALSSFVEVIDIKQYELSGFTVTGDAIVDGNVGIGTDTPTEKLTVVGNISASGSISTNGETVVSSPTIEHIVELTQSEYDSLTPDANTFYVITDASDYGPVSFPIKAINANYSVLATDYTLKVTTSSTLTLPTAIGCGGRLYNFKNWISGGSTMTIAAASGETIDGSSTFVSSTQYQSLTIQSDGSGWIII